MSFLLFGVTLVYANMVSEARMEYIFSDFSFSSVSYSKITEEAALSTGIMFCFFIFMFLFGLLRVKTRTSKVLSIIGGVLSFCFVVWSIVVFMSPSAISFDEVFFVWLLFSLIVISFSIVGLIQSVRFRRMIKSGQVVVKSTESIDLLDS